MGWICPRVRVSANFQIFALRVLLHSAGGGTSVSFSWNSNIIRSLFEVNETILWDKRTDTETDIHTHRTIAFRATKQ